MPFMIGLFTPVFTQRMCSFNSLFLTLAALWGDGSTSSSDGQNFRVGSHGRYAGQSKVRSGAGSTVLYAHF